jgi:hypothetical protein
MILRDGMVPVLVGMACGCIAAIFSGRMLAALLFGVNSEDGLVLTCAGFTLIVIGMLASYIPARGAGRLDRLPRCAANEWFVLDHSALRYGLQSAVRSLLLKKIAISSAPIFFARTSGDVALTCAIAGI